MRYDGIIMDPPAFGRGPDGEVWTLAALFPALCQACRAILSSQPLFIVITVYTREDVAGVSGADGIVDRPAECWWGPERILTVAASRERLSARWLLVNSLFARWERMETHGKVQSSETGPFWLIESST